MQDPPEFFRRICIISLFLRREAEMKLQDLLIDNRTAILEKWFQLILESYPAESVKFLGQKKDRFANPVGYSISHGINDLFNELIDEPAENFKSALDEIVKIRSVQDFSPSQAIAFIFLLKLAVYEILEKEIVKNLLHKDLRSFEAKIDRMALIAFDSYMESKRKLFDIRVKEAKSQTSRLIDRLNKKPDDSVLYVESESKR